MKMKQHQKLKTTQLKLWVGMGSIMVVFAIAMLLNLGKVENSRAGITTENTWVGGHGNNWTEAANWSMNTVPDRQSRAIIANEAQVEVPARKEVETGELMLQKGAVLTVKGGMEVSNDVRLTDRQTLLQVAGELKVHFDVEVLGMANFEIAEKGQTTINGDLTIENAGCTNYGDTKVDKNLELRRFGAAFIQKEGTALVKNVVLHASNGNANALQVLGGTMEIVENASFVAEQEGSNTKGRMVVNDGYLKLHSVLRNELFSYQLPEAIHIEINGGTIDFCNTLNFDTTKTELPHLGEGVPLWRADKTYSRKTANDVLAVKYKNNVYWLSESVWNSSNEKPDESSKWIEMGEASAIDQFSDCSKLEAWDKNKTYTRQVNKELFVTHNGDIFRLNRSCNMTKANEPGDNDWAWLRWGACLGAKTVFFDKLIAKGGTLIFREGWNHQGGVQLSNATTVRVENGINPLVLNDNDIFGNLIIANGAQIKLSGKAQISGDLLNHSDKHFAGNGRLTLVGGATQQVGGTVAIQLKNLVLNKDSGKVLLTRRLTLTDSLIWQKPVAIIAKFQKNANEYPAVHFAKNAGFSGLGWVNAPVLKKGNASFVFPVGANSHAAYFALNNPDDSFECTVRYIDSKAPESNRLSAGLSRVSQMEYWVVSNTYGAETMVPTAYWSNAVWSYIDVPDDLLLTGYNGKNWVSVGNRFVKSDGGSGSITAVKPIGSMQYVTFGSSGNDNPLAAAGNPFTVDDSNGNLHISWSSLPPQFNQLTVYSGSDSNALFIEKKYSRSQLEMLTEINLPMNESGQHWIGYQTAGGGETIMAVSKVDAQLVGNISALSAYPNPFNSQFTLSFSSTLRGTGRLELTDLSGRMVYANQLAVVPGENKHTIVPDAVLSPGQYVAVLRLQNEIQQIRIQKN